MTVENDPKRAITAPYPEFCNTLPKGIHCFSTRLQRGPQQFRPRRVSVPRRGFIVFLPLSRLPNRAQSPLGSACVCFEYYPRLRYHAKTSFSRAEASLTLHFSQIRASPPAPKTRGMLESLTPLSLSVALFSISPTTASRQAAPFTEHRQNAPYPPRYSDFHTTMAPGSSCSTSAPLVTSVLRKHPAHR